MRAYRLTREPYRQSDRALECAGAARYGGRWNPPGVALAYAASSVALAALERLVHTMSVKGLEGLWLQTLEFSAAECRVLVPEELPATWNERRVPPDWSVGEAATQTVGREWIRAGESLALRVPSAVIPLEFNYLINPEHQALRLARLAEPQQFMFDERLRSLLRNAP